LTLLYLHCCIKADDNSPAVFALFASARAWRMMHRAIKSAVVDRPRIDNSSPFPSGASILFSMPAF
jgi:hypothetical protein